MQSSVSSHRYALRNVSNSSLRVPPLFSVAEQELSPQETPRLHLRQSSSRDTSHLFLNSQASSPVLSATRAKEVGRVDDATRHDSHNEASSLRNERRSQQADVSNINCPKPRAHVPPNRLTSDPEYVSVKISYVFMDCKKNGMLGGIPTAPSIPFSDNSGVFNPLLIISCNRDFHRRRATIHITLNLFHAKGNGSIHSPSRTFISTG